MELAIIEIGSTEWNKMWDWLASHPINEGLTEPSVATNNGESWQYVGSYKQGERVIHSFRHRNHPTTNTLQNLSVAASNELTKEQIKKSFKL
jgi:hypothetical protein